MFQRFQTAEVLRSILQSITPISANCLLWRIKRESKGEEPSETVKSDEIQYDPMRPPPAFDLHEDPGKAPQERSARVSAMYELPIACLLGSIAQCHSIASFAQIAWKLHGNFGGKSLTSGTPKMIGLRRMQIFQNCYLLHIILLSFDRMHWAILGHVISWGPHLPPLARL